MNISGNVSSMLNNQAMLDQSAKRVASAGSQNANVDLAKETTTQIVAQDSNAVNASAVKTQDKMLGTLLDMKA